jgi:hypothetical protein
LFVFSGKTAALSLGDDLGIGAGLRGGAGFAGGGTHGAAFCMSTTIFCDPSTSVSFCNTFYSTQDLDIVYRRGTDSLTKLVAALHSYKPYLRGAPPNLPFRLDIETLKSGLNFTLTTDIGWIDLLGELAGGGRYEDLAPNSLRVQAFGVECRILDLETLIRTKKAAGRPQDFDVLAELEVLRERSRGS